MDPEPTSIPFRPTRSSHSGPTNETKTTIKPSQPPIHSQLTTLSPSDSTTTHNLDELVASLETALKQTSFDDSDQSSSDTAAAAGVTSSSCGQLHRSAGTSITPESTSASSSVVSPSDVLLSSVVSPNHHLITNISNKPHQNGVPKHVSSNPQPNPPHQLHPSVPRIVCVQLISHQSSPSPPSSILPCDHVPSMRSIRVLPKTQSLDIVDEDNDELVAAGSRSVNKPIYPNVPYSPYGSPFGSPRGRKRQPFRESRRVSVENVGSFLQLNQYQLFEKIGQGSYGLVKMAYCEEDSTSYAMKILSKRKLLRKVGLMARGPKRGLATSPLDRVYREIAVLKKLDHPNVVKLVEVLDDPVEDELYMVFELVRLGAVLTVPTNTPLSEDRAWSVFRDAVLGLEYLHYQRIIHSDIKPDNLLLGEDGRVKIADLGVCNEFIGDDASMSNVSTPGTPAFRAPETLLVGQHSYSGKAIDVWALGVTLFALVYGNVPFYADNVPALYDRIRRDSLAFSVTTTTTTSTADGTGCLISDELRQLILAMLDKDPATRITLPQIKQHDWVTRSGSNPLPTEEENCLLVDVTDDDMSSVVKSIPKLDTLILIKKMLKQHSFQNPFVRKSAKGLSRTERFLRAGRSNSAPGAYHGMDRQVSSESLLAPVSEVIATSSKTAFTEEDAEREDE